MTRLAYHSDSHTASVHLTSKLCSHTVARRKQARLPYQAFIWILHGVLASILLMMPLSAHGQTQSASRPPSAVSNSPAVPKPYQIEMLPDHLLVTGLTPAQIQKHLTGSLSRLPPVKARQFQFVRPFQDPLFPPDDSWRFGFYPTDPAFTTWLKLSSADRAFDLLIQPEMDYYWKHNGLSYRVNYIVHFESLSEPRPVAVPNISSTAQTALVAPLAQPFEAAPFTSFVPPESPLPTISSAASLSLSHDAHPGLGPLKTKVSVILMEPMENHGKAFRWMGHAGPGWYWDLRAGTLSEAARLEFLQFIASGLEQADIK